MAIQDMGSVSDGYHTFDELYEHRIVLFIALCKEINVHEYRDSIIWRSKLHSDGTPLDGFFIMGINEEPGSQITYHLPIERWEEVSFARTRDKAPEYDGHSPQNVLDRLSELLPEKEVIWAQCLLAGCVCTFIVAPGEHAQKYCSKAHKMRDYRKRKKQEATNADNTLAPVVEL